MGSNNYNIHEEDVDHGHLAAVAPEDQDEEDNSSLGLGRSYECVFCKRGFNTAQALGGHMNIHRKDRASCRNKPPAAANSTTNSNNKHIIDHHQVDQYAAVPRLPRPYHQQIIMMNPTCYNYVAAHEQAAGATQFINYAARSSCSRPAAASGTILAAAGQSASFFTNQQQQYYYCSPQRFNPFGDVDGHQYWSMSLDPCGVSSAVHVEDFHEKGRRIGGQEDDHHHEVLDLELRLGHN